MLAGCVDMEFCRYVSVFLRNVPLSVSLLTLQVEAVCSSRMAVLAYEHIYNDHNLNAHRTENTHLRTPVLLHLPTRLVQWYWFGLVFMRHLVCIWWDLYIQWALDSCCAEVLDYQENVEQEVLKPVICRLYALVYFISILLFRRDVSYCSNNTQAFILRV